MNALLDQPETQARIGRAAEWFGSLQQKILAAFAIVEAEAKGPFFDEAGGPGQPEFKPWERKNHDGSPGGGGRMGMLRGRVFEKCGVHFSHVHGQFAPEFASQIPERIPIRAFPPAAYRSSRIPGTRMRRPFT